MVNLEEKLMTGLILEGGGMRGAYTAGVLDFFIDNNIEFDNVYGVSAGAVNACSYLSKQRGRAFRVDVDYLEEKDYAGFSCWLRTGDFFGVDFCYNRIPNELNPYDKDTFNSYTGNFYSVVTNCETGQAEYMKIVDMDKDLIKIRASASLPLLSRFVEIDGTKYLDGGIGDSIPIYHARKSGCKKNVIVLTRDKSYRKSKNKMLLPVKLKYRKYPELIKRMKNRHILYNKTLKYIEKLEEQGKVVVIRPTSEVKIGRLEKDKEKLTQLYHQGYNDAKEKYQEIVDYLSK